MKVGDLVRIEGCALPLGIITSMRPMSDGTQYVTVYETGLMTPENGSSWCIDREVEVISESR